MIKFSHTVFALPFALSAVVIIYSNYRPSLTLKDILLIILAFTGMRSFSMAFNRLADRKIDAKNARTAGREIPAGILKVRETIIFAVISLLVMWICAWLLSPVAFFLSFPAVVLLALYSYTKRFTPLCHVWLGAVIGMAPVAVSIALLQTVIPESIFLGLIVTTYIAGFDILYSLQDAEFDKKNNLHSFPADFGINASLFFSAVLHTITAGLVWYGLFFLHGKLLYTAGAGILTALLFYEHYIVGWGNSLRADKIPVAFFHVNSVISLVFLVMLSADKLIV
jgi:4-hydroxybenzoate polyprenyltransferase